jgi:hypothetical protein
MILVIFCFCADCQLILVTSSIDLDFPLGVDDEYWEIPDPTAWKQPSDKPALTDYSRSNLKLLEILAFTLRSTVST